MAAAYAAVISLRQTVQRLLDPSHPAFSSLIYSDLWFLKHFLKRVDTRRSSNEKKKRAESQIRDAAHKWEDLIESHVSDSSEISGVVDDEALTLVLSQAMLQVKQEFSSLVEALKTEVAEWRREEEEEELQLQSGSDFVSSETTDPGWPIPMVGMDDKLRKLLDWICEPSLSIMGLLGMAGIGKTALAKLAYSHSVVVEYFDCRVFVAVGPRMQLRTILLLVLHQLGVQIDDQKREEHTDQLGERVSSNLFGRRYLIVLDGVWNARFWVEVRRFFPYNYNNGSTIIMTTRLEDVAGYFRSKIIRIPFLNDDDSWELLRKTAFTSGESCDSELEKIGKKIAKNCEGLPLLIIRVGELLRDAEKTVQRLRVPSHPASSSLIYVDLWLLESFLKRVDTRRSSNEKKKRAESQIRDAAHKWEDLIESHVSDYSSEISGVVDDEALTSVLSQAMLEVSQELSSLIEALRTEEAEWPEEEEEEELQLQSGSDFVSSETDPDSMVGMDDTLMKLLDCICRRDPVRSIIGLVGMAGIGKTAFAKLAFYHLDVVQHFEYRIFVAVGPRMQSKTFMLLVLHQLGGFQIDDQMREENIGQLGARVYGMLDGRRYLIVLDGVWNTRVWGEVRMFFPDNNNGSRIVMTTRLKDVACVFTRQIINIPFLNDDDSWELLRKTVFTSGESCDSELEEIGKKIAKNCEGLPLLIIGVGELLRDAEKTVENWKKVEDDDNPLNIRADDDTPISKTLSLSYDHLPVNLKTFFLYMGVFPKKYVVSLSELARLWVSEGLIEPHYGRRFLDEAAEEYVAALVSNSVVLVLKQKSRNGIKSCGVHSVYRLLCVSKAWNEKFFHVINKYADIFRGGAESQRRLCIHNKVVLGFKQVLSSMEESFSGAHSFICFGKEDQRPLRIHLPFRLLRILNALTIRFFIFPHQVLELIHLRYLSITYNGEIPASISRLWNLEVLIIHPHYHLIQISSNCSRVYYLPKEVWKLNRLRHLECVGLDLPDPSADGNDSVVILENLLTLSGVSAHSCTRGILARVPNLIKLGVRIVKGFSEAIETFSFFGDIAEFCGRLESFKCIVVNPPDLRASQVVVTSIPLAFPDSVRKITLSGCGFPWESMTHIGRLPNLQVLKLRCHAFRGPEWGTVEREFRKLKHLLLEDLDIEQWTIDAIDANTHFPSLKCLILRHCYRLREIPTSIGDIAGLNKIEVDDCSPSIYQKVREEQDSLYGSDDLLQIHSSWEI